MNTLTPTISEALKKYRIDPQWYQEQHNQLCQIGFSVQQSNTITLRESPARSVEMVVKSHHQLLSLFSYTTITNIASNNGGSKTL